MFTIDNIENYRLGGQELFSSVADFWRRADEIFNKLVDLKTSIDTRGNQTYDMIKCISDDMVYFKEVADKVFKTNKEKNIMDFGVIDRVSFQLQAHEHSFKTLKDEANYND